MVPASNRPNLSTTAAFVRRHWLFLALTCVGIALRAVTQVAYRPAIIYIDSFSYLANTDVDNVDPDQARPIGYSVLLLRWLLPWRELALVPLVQHLLGLGMAVAIYAVLTRRQAPRWLAAAATTPVLLDGYQLQIEQNVMADTLFQGLLVAAFAVLLWFREPRRGTTLGAGLLLGLAVTVRPIGLLLIGVMLAYVVLVGPNMRRRLATGVLAAAAFAIPLATYATWYVGADRPSAPSGYQGKVLYGRVAPVADCGELTDEPRRIRALCPREPVAHREGVDHYIHSDSSPANRRAGVGAAANSALRTFAWQVVANQPLDVAAAVATDFVKGFAPVRTAAPDDVPLERWRFQPSYPVYGQRDPSTVTLRYDDERPQASRELGGFLRTYQSFGYTPGPLLAGCVLVGLVAGVTRAGRKPLPAAAMLMTASGVALMLAPAFVEFSWRYQLPATVLLPWAGALGLTALLQRWRERSPAVTRVSTQLPGAHPADEAGETPLT